MSRAAVIDLFAGAGGFAVAAKLARTDLRLSVEWDATCCQTLEANHLGSSHRVEQADIRELEGRDLRTMAGVSRQDVVLIVGGPPCQPFSKASYWLDAGDDARYRRARSRGEDALRPQAITEARQDERRNLLRDYFRLVVEARADGFVMENVRSLLHPRNIGMFEELVRSFERAGYHCTVCKADATSYGVPQKRARVFLLGSRVSKPATPKPSHRSEDADSEEELPPPPGVKEFIAPYASKAFYEEGEEVHGRWADCLREIPPGKNYKHLSAWAGHPRPVFEAETRFWNFLLKLSPEAPSWTINANPGPWVGPFHWKSRRLRTPELAAIQSFPHGYKFLGNRRERIRQIGNAVPPQMAKAMISSVTATFKH